MISACVGTAYTGTHTHTHTQAYPSVSLSDVCFLGLPHKHALHLLHRRASATQALYNCFRCGAGMEFLARRHCSCCAGIVFLLRRHSFCCAGIMLLLLGPCICCTSNAFPPHCSCSVFLEFEGLTHFWGFLTYSTTVYNSPLTPHSYRLKANPMPLPWESLWEGLEEIWESFGRLRGSSGGLWRSSGRPWESSGGLYK